MDLTPENGWDHFSEICPEHAASSSSKWFSTVKPSSCVLSFPLLNPFGEAKRKAKDELKAPQLSSCLTRGARRGSARDVQRALPPRQECLSRRPRHGVSTASLSRHATHVPPGSLQGYFGLLPWRDSSPGWLRHSIPGGRPRIVKSLPSPQSQGVTSRGTNTIHPGSTGLASVWNLKRPISHATSKHPASECWQRMTPS